MLTSDIDKNAFVQNIREEARKIWYTFPTIDYCLKIGISSWEALWADFDGEGKELEELRSLAKKYRESSWRNALQKIGINDPEIAGQLSEAFKQIRNGKHVLFSDTPECLGILRKRYKLGLITNGAPDIQWKKIRRGGLTEYFNEILVSGEFGVGKPDKRIFQELLNRMGCETSNAIMIGDSLQTDIKGSAEAGIKNIWLNRGGKESEEIKPDHEINTLESLHRIIN
jgi:putative hydrolase of the HAD superfamily